MFVVSLLKRIKTMKRGRLFFLENGDIRISVKKGNTTYYNFITNNRHDIISEEELFGKNGLVYKGYKYTESRVKRQRCYDSGKIRGLEKIQFSENFLKADYQIFFMGYKPISPLKNGLPDKAPYWLHMFIDLCLLASCKSAYFQKNWKDSRGAKIEHKFATFLGKDILYQKY